MSGRILPVSFYARDTEIVARELLGAVLECTVGGVRCTGMIVETEAYTGEEDLACHAVAGRTVRTEVLYGPPGRAYVYFVYGMHWCVNAVTRRAGLPSAVLIRAIAPLEGISAMRRRRTHRDRNRSLRERPRRTMPDRDLTNGPAKLCEAFGITGPRFNGVSLVRSPLRIRAGLAIPDGEIEVTPRIGISRAVPDLLRWAVRGNPFVSG